MGLKTPVFYLGSKPPVFYPFRIRGFAVRSVVRPFGVAVHTFVRSVVVSEFVRSFVRFVRSFAAVGRSLPSVVRCPSQVGRSFDARARARAYAGAPLQQYGGPNGAPSKATVRASLCA